ncbi:MULTISPECIES: hypothetical protein [Microbacterium]|uniref:hypothetical protein n=1 Tax=Microbacterium TaxID=33882 RepID=UPI0024AEB498|nr:hypothetical protein [Microbacterium barkeri]MDI6944994.1 hypothetical protein [Microbacterium barkeri]
MSPYRSRLSATVAGSVAGAATLLVAIGAALLAGAVANADPGDEAAPPSPTPTASATPTPTASATPVATEEPEPPRRDRPAPPATTRPAPEPDRDEHAEGRGRFGDRDLEKGPAEELVEEVLTPPDAEDAARPGDLEALLADVTAGAYRAELEAQWLELSANGWSYVGESQVVGLEILALDEEAEPATAQVKACIDASGLELVDADGERIGSEKDTHPRAAHLFDLVYEDGTWRVLSRSFPDDPAC